MRKKIDNLVIPTDRIELVAVQILDAAIQLQAHMFYIYSCSMLSTSLKFIILLGYHSIILTLVPNYSWSTNYKYSFIHRRTSVVREEVYGIYNR